MGRRRSSPRHHYDPFTYSGMSPRFAATAAPSVACILEDGLVSGGSPRVVRHLFVMVYTSSSTKMRKSSSHFSEISQFR